MTEDSEVGCRSAWTTQSVTFSYVTKGWTFFSSEPLLLTRRPKHRHRSPHTESLVATPSYCCGESPRRLRRHSGSVVDNWKAPGSKPVRVADGTEGAVPRACAHLLSTVRFVRTTVEQGRPLLCMPLANLLCAARTTTCPPRRQLAWARRYERLR